MVDFFHLKKDRSILYRFVPHNYKTPPYVTGIFVTNEANPEIIQHDISENDRFMVLATDGLWERLSNEQVVAAVNSWLDNKKDGKYPRIDDDPSTHLIRHAFIEPLSIKDHTPAQKLALLMSIPSDQSRRYRDDITITVVLFKNEKNEKLKGPAFEIDQRDLKWPRDMQIPSKL